MEAIRNELYQMNSLTDVVPKIRIGILIIAITIVKVSVSSRSRTFIVEISYRL